MNTDISFTHATLNVRGIRDPKKRLTVFNYLTKKNIDIIFLQETFSTPDKENEFKKNWPGKIFFSHSNSPHCKGVAILFNQNLQVEEIDIHRDTEGRKILMNISINNAIVTLINIYAPSSGITERIKFLKRTKTWSKQHCINANMTIASGDFNTVDEAVDRSSGKVDSSGQHFTAFKKYNGLVDIWRLKHPDTQQFTFINPGNPLIGSRIDQTLISNVLSVCVKKSEIIPSPTPDHLALITEFKNINRPRGPSYWKMNVSILKHPEYKKGIKEIHNNINRDYSGKLSKDLLWDFKKIKFREYSIKYSIEIQKEKRNEYKKLEKEILNVNKEIIDNPGNVDHLKLKRNALQAEFEKFHLEKAQGYQIRSRAKYVQEGEKNSSYFLKLEQAHQTYNRIDQLIDKDGQIIDTDPGILSECVIFYDDLYKSTNPDTDKIDKYLDSVKSLKTLDDIDSNKCEGLISRHECETVLKRMKNNKSPGPDGLPVEFYKTFWDLLGTELVDTFNECYQNGELTDSQKRSVISLIFKKSDRRLLKYYRPISLSNTDYKIVAFALADRLHQVLPKLVSEDQMGYIKKRFIGNNVRCLEDLIYYACKKKIGGIFLFLDFQKAFDSLEWPFMFKVLEKFKFKPMFINWVKALYNQPEAVIKNNGWISEPFRLKRGIRQGCSLSALLFILATEVLATSIKENEKIKGIKVDARGSIKEIKSPQYADDTTLTLASHKVIKDALEQIESFTVVSGLKLNLAKTEAMGIGTEKGYAESESGIKWNNEAIRCLGVYIGHNKLLCQKHNWDDKLEEMQKLVDVWRLRNTTLIGKIVIIKSLLLPKIIYSALNTEIPDKMTDKLNTLLYKFLWGGKNDRINRNTIISKYEEGGLKMIHLKSFFMSLKASWIYRILDPNNQNSSSFLAKSLLQISGIELKTIKYLGFSAKNAMDRIKSLPAFYIEVIMSFAEANRYEIPTKQKDILDSCLWGNNIFMIHKKQGKAYPVYFRNWINSNIMFVKDLKITNGVLDANYVYQKIQNKANFHIEVRLLQKALNRYKNIIGTTTPSPYPPPDYYIMPNKGKSKYFYERLISNYYKPMLLTKWSVELATNIPDKLRREIFKRNISINDKIISTFKYKVISRILACGYLVSKWDPTCKAMCEICDEKDDIVHLLYKCEIAKDTWSKVGAIIGHVPTKFEVIMIMREDHELHLAIANIAYILYKYWLVCKDTNTRRSLPHFRVYLKNEMINRKTVYKEIDYITQNISKYFQILLLICKWCWQDWTQ